MTRPRIPEHLVTPEDYAKLIAATRMPLTISYDERGPLEIHITVTRTRWQRWFVNRHRWKRQILADIGRRKQIGLDVEVTVV